MVAKVIPIRYTRAMLDNGAVKTVVALLPAIVAILLMYVGDKRSSPLETLPIAILFLIVGGFLSALFLTQGLGRQSGVIVKVLVFFLIAVGYIGTFAFTGCLAAARL